MQYFIHHNNQQIGPFSEAEVKAKLTSGEILATDHVWWEGQQGWVPLSQTPLAGAPSAPTGPIPGTAAAAAYPTTSAKVTSKLAIWALVCGCLSFLCGLFAAIPAIILGHMGVNAIKQNPELQGRGMALSGLILGYFMTIVPIIAIIVLIALGNQVQNVFSTINSQISSAQADQSTNSADQSTNNTPTATPTDNK